MLERVKLDKLANENCEATSLKAEIHSSHDHEIHHHVITFFESCVNETISACNGIKSHFNGSLANL